MVVLYSYLQIVIILVYSTYGDCTTALPASCADLDLGDGNDNNNDPLCDKRTYVDTFYTTLAASYITHTTGTVSTISSAIIILMIIRSSIRLDSIYHRIMFGMSAADIMGSIAMALNTVPMPVDIIYEFAGKRLGNTGTCTAQGFFFFFGTNATAAYNSSLCVYYLCSIRYKMRDARISRRIEPVLHALSILLTLPLSILVLEGDFYNPTPFDAWCTGEPYPWYCRDEKCTIRGKMNEITILIRYYLIFLFSLQTFITIFSMVTIVWYVHSQERLLNGLEEHIVRRGRTLNTATNNRLVASRRRHKFTKVLLTQALAYIGAFFICQSNVILSLLIRKKPRWVQVYHLVTRPLQGFFNLIIFVVHKVYDVKSLNPRLTTRQAIWQVIKEKEEPVFVFSNISLIRIDDNNADDGLIFEGDDDDDDEEEEDISNDPSGASEGLELSPRDNLNNTNIATSTENVQTRSLPYIDSNPRDSRTATTRRQQRDRNSQEENFVDDEDNADLSHEASSSRQRDVSIFSSIGSMFSYISRNNDVSDVVSSEGVLRSEDSIGVILDR